MGVALCVAALWVALSAFGADIFERRRMDMIREIERDIGYTAEMTGRKRFDERVMEAMATVARHDFVPRSEQAQAYENRPLAIGYGQTISQPYIVALMTDLLEPRDGHTVLEIGTGSGYQAAVLSKLVRRVYSVEIIPELAAAGSERLRRLGYDNVIVRHSDGYYGWEEHGPYDGIIVTAAAARVPPPLIGQLAPGGRMVIPIGDRFTTQYLMLITRSPEGRIQTRQVLPVRFVPLTGEH